MKNGKIKVVLGKIIVINPVGEGKYPTITPSSKGILTINGKVIYEATKVKESDEIEFLPNDKLSKDIKVDISKNKMEAYISFKYRNAIKINIKDSEPVENLVIDVYEEEMDCIGLLSKEEIEQLLKEANVTYGIKEEAVEEITKAQNGGRVLVAEGLKPIDAIDEKIEFVFNKEDSSIGEYEKIDYKNINKINGVEATAIIGKVIRGRDCKFGINVFGEEVKPKKNKRKIIRCGNGCNFLDDNIIAEIDGQVSYKNETVSVNKVYRITSNVDISTGNINFEGDIQIDGNVNEGMGVYGKNNVNVLGGVFSGQVVASSDINITGSVVNSKVISGGSEVRKQERINGLQMFLRTYEALIETLEYLVDKGILKNESNIPEVMHQLLESKFKEFNKQAMNIISLAIKDGDKNSQVSKFIKEKLLPMSRTNIKSIKELRDFVISLLEEIQYLEEYMANMSSITLSYCQEASIQSSGDILINGKGLYSTDMYAVRSIKFLNKQSVCRGGVLKAGESINASVVGSEAGAQTVLEVFGKKGIVTIEKAYSNTLIIINNKRYLVTESCRNVKAYIDNKGELAVEKLLL